MIPLRIALFLIVLFCCTFVARSQDGSGDSTTIDSLDVQDTLLNTDTTLVTDSSFSGIDDSLINSITEPEPLFSGRRGLIFVDVSASLSSLQPSVLAPGLDGTIVWYGVSGYTLLNGWLIGGGWTGGHLYGQPSTYEDFTYSYAGILFGYDTRITLTDQDGLTTSDALSLRGDLSAGPGSMEIVKKRPDLGATILDRVREESFYYVRPGLSVGYSLPPIFEIRVGVNYLYPFGSGVLDDLRHFSYGLQFIIGF